ncbi:MAG: hypothetical protein ACREL1_07965 [bacterium]
MPVPRGTPGDLWADRVLGQPDNGIPNSGFGDIQFGQANSGTLFKGLSTVVDRVHGLLYVWDAGNNRILGIPVTNLHPNPNQNDLGYNATIVLGQPDFYHTGCNHDSNWQNFPTPPGTDATCLCGLLYYSQSPAEAGGVGNMAVDGAGNLYVPDFGNNRVLRYDWPISSGQAASHVWGQPNFSSYATNDNGYNQSGSAGQSNLSFPSPSNQLDKYVSGVGLDAWGNLWVVDDGNNRVLRFPNPNAPNPGIAASTADVVLGQSSFSGTDGSQMYQPSAVRIDRAGNVYVSAYDNYRSVGGVGSLLIYEPTSFSASGVPIYGTNMVSTPSMVVTQAMVNPQGLEWDVPATVVSGVTLGGIGGAPAAGGTGGLWVSDNYGAITLFKITLSSSPATVLSVVPDKVLLSDQFDYASTGTTGDNPGEANFVDASGSSVSTWGDENKAGDMIFGSVGVDSLGNVFVGGQTWMDVWRFPAPIPTPQPQVAHSADVALFKPYHFGGANQPDVHNMYYAFGVAIGNYEGVTQIIESSDLIRFWNMPAAGPSGLQNGQAVDGVIGAPDPSQPLFNGQGYFGRVKTDQVGHLWAQSPNSGAVWIFPLPLTNGETASVTLACPIPVLGSGQFVNWSASNGDLAVDPNDQFLWISDPPNSRVLRIRNPLTNPQVDIILGQPNATSVMVDYPDGAPHQTNLNFPGGLALDHQGNLYVADHSLEFRGDSRLLRYDAASIQNTSNTALYGIPASAVYGAGGLSNFDSAGCANTDQNAGVCGPWGPAVNSDDSILVVGSDAQVTNNRMVLALSQPLLGDGPITALKDYSPQAYSEAFDDQDNLYVTNHNRSRIFIYLDPFPKATPTSAPTDTPTVTCTAAPSPIPTGSPTPSPSPTVTPTLTPTETVTATPSPEASQKPYLYPNPVRTNDSVHLYPGLSSPEQVEVKLFTTAFRKVRDIRDQRVVPGQEIIFDPVDDWGSPLANGLYYVVVYTPQRRIILKLLVLR